MTCWLMFDMSAINMFFTKLCCPECLESHFSKIITARCTYLQFYWVDPMDAQSTMNAPLASKGLSKYKYLICTNKFNNTILFPF